jgi:uncharacterized protein (TIGR03435 family)
VKLEWTPNDTRAQQTTGSQPGPSIYIAVREQLGLKLEARKGLLEILVVDSAQKVPLAN